MRREINLAEKTTLVEQVAGIIMSDLRSACPGDRIDPERRLAEKYSVSRKTAREALGRLTTKGLLERRVGKGTFVSDKLRGHRDIPVKQLVFVASFPSAETREFFEKINVDREIVSPSYFYGDYRQSDVYIESVKNEKPGTHDIINLDEGTLPVFAESGVLEPLDGYIERSSEIDTGLFHPAILKALTRKGRLYGIPQTFFTNVLFYNKKLFREKGLGFPDASWKWRDLMRAAGKLTSLDSNNGRSKSYGIGFFHSSANMLMPFVCQNFAPDVDLHSIKPFERPETVEALYFTLDMLHKDKVCPFFHDDLFMTSEKMFEDGKIAMFIGSYKNYIELNCDFDWGIAELPGRKRKFTSLPVQGWGICAGSMNKANAFSVIEKWLDRDIASGIASGLKRISAVNGHNDPDIPAVFRESLDFAGSAVELFPPTAEARIKFGRQMSMLLNNFCSPEEFCEKMSK